MFLREQHLTCRTWPILNILLSHFPPPLQYTDTEDEYCCCLWPGCCSSTPSGTRNPSSSTQHITTVHIHNFVAPVSLNVILLAVYYIMLGLFTLYRECRRSILSLCDLLSQFHCILNSQPGPWLFRCLPWNWNSDGNPRRPTAMMLRWVSSIFRLGDPCHV